MIMWSPEKASHDLFAGSVIWSIAQVGSICPACSAATIAMKSGSGAAACGSLVRAAPLRSGKL